MKFLTDPSVKSLVTKILLCGTLVPVLAAALFQFYPENALQIVFAAAFCLSAVVLILCGRWLQKREQALEDAASQIAAYRLDNRQPGMECDEEGAIHHLFHEVHSLVSIVNAHAGREQQTKEFLKDTISDISHQLKTPIAALSVYNGILQQEAADAATVRKFANLSEQELDRMDSLVQALLKMARLDAGAITLERSAESVPGLLEDVKRAYSFRAEQEGKEIVLEGDSQSVLICDRAWLSEAMGNILKNALDHTASGSRILICWKQSPYLTQIMVQDSGSGIHPEDLYHIFKRFYRSRFSKDTQGVGLGLPLAKAVIEAHKGSVEVRSDLGSGTTFTINFPR